jgi:hypothetical protein
MSLHRRVEARDRGLARVSRLTSLTLSGGLVLSGGFAALAARAYSGHSRRAFQAGAGNSLVRTGSVASGRSLLTPGTTAPAAPLGTPQTLPQAAPQTVPSTTPYTVPQYVAPAPLPPDPIVSGGS